MIGRLGRLATRSRRPRRARVTGVPPVSYDRRTKSQTHFSVGRTGPGPPRDAVNSTHIHPPARRGRRSLPGIPIRVSIGRPSDTGGTPVVLDRQDAGAPWGRPHATNRKRPPLQQWPFSGCCCWIKTQDWPPSFGFSSFFGSSLGAAAPPAGLPQTSTSM